MIPWQRPFWVISYRILQSLWLNIGEISLRLQFLQTKFYHLKIHIKQNSHKLISSERLLQQEVYGTEPQPILQAATHMGYEIRDHHECTYACSRLWKWYGIRDPGSGNHMILKQQKLLRQVDFRRMIIRSGSDVEVRMLLMQVDFANEMLLQQRFDDNRIVHF